MRFLLPRHGVNIQTSPTKHGHVPWRTPIPRFLYHSNPEATKRSANGFSWLLQLQSMLKSDGHIMATLHYSAQDRARAYQVLAHHGCKDGQDRPVGQNHEPCICTSTHKITGSVSPLTRAGQDPLQKRFEHAWLRFAHAVNSLEMGIALSNGSNGCVSAFMTLNLTISSVSRAHLRVKTYENFALQCAAPCGKMNGAVVWRDFVASYFVGEVQFAGFRFVASCRELPPRRMQISRQAVGSPDGIHGRVIAVVCGGACAPVCASACVFVYVHVCACVYCPLHFR